jgi:pyrroline-5-carboxylate reductase
MTLVHPPNAAAAELFDRLGEAIEVAEAEEFDALIASTATVGLHFAYLSAITAWLQAHGIPESAATRYIADMFAGLAEPTRSGESFETLAQERSTPGGLNEQFRNALEHEGFLEDVRAGLDRILDGLKAT